MPRALRLCDCGRNAGVAHLVSHATYYRHQHVAQAQNIASQLSLSSAGGTTTSFHTGLRVSVSRNSSNVLQDTNDDIARSRESDQDSAADNLLLEIEPDAQSITSCSSASQGVTDEDDRNTVDHEGAVGSPESEQGSIAIDDENENDFDYESIGLDTFTSAQSQSLRLLQTKISKNASEAQHDNYVAEFNRYLQDSKTNLHPESKITAYAPTARLLERQTAINHVRIECCSSSCVAYTDQYEHLTECPKCSKARERLSTVDYIPVIHRLRLQYSDPDRSKTLGEYRSVIEQSSDADTITDFSQTDYFLYLQEQGLFKDSRELAFSLYTDGISLFNVGEHSVSPVILINLNLPLDERFKIQNILLLMVVPGPREFQNINSWFYPLVEEFKLLYNGVTCWDGYKKEYFTLKAYICLALGDQPAASKLMGHSGHNHYFYCRYCLIEGIRAFGAVRCPHTKPKDVDLPDFEDYDVLRLPIRKHSEHIVDAKQVSVHLNDKVTSSTGIKDLSILFSLPSIQMPISSPPGLMHIFELLSPLMWSLWSSSGTFEKHSGNWQLSKPVLAQIGSDMISSATHLPSVFGRALRNIVAYQGSFKASDHMTWCMIVSPVLLAGRLSEPYYSQWTSFIRALKELMSPFERSRLPHLKACMARFISHYEMDYYQMKSENLQMCRTCVHYIAHLADCAIETGILTHNWEFVIERYVGRLKSLTKSRFSANRSLSLNALTQEQLNHLPYVCNNSEIRAKFRTKPVITGLLSNPSPATDIILRPTEFTQLSILLGQLYDVPQTRIRTKLPTRKEAQFSKYFRYRNDIHTIGAMESRKSAVDRHKARADYYIRYQADKDNSEYAAVQYFLEVPTDMHDRLEYAEVDSMSTRAPTLSLAYIDLFEVVEDARQLSLVTNLRTRSLFIECSSIDGLVGLLSKDSCFYVVDTDSAFLYLD